MDRLRIVHCADVHLETTFGDTRAGPARRQALAGAFARIVVEALRLDADVLTIGGDLYESARAGPQARRFLYEQFARFGKPVYVAPGNHDPYAAGSLLAGGDVPINVKVFNEAAWRAYPLSNSVTLYGFGHTPAEPGRPFTGARFEHSGIRIALVHGSDEERCPPGKRATAPFTAKEIAASGATLLLSGHYHGGYVASLGGKPILAYPGSPEPIKFGEGGVHGGLVLTVEGGTVRVEPFGTARTRLVEAACRLDGVANEHAAFACIEQALSAYGRDDYVRLRLTGTVVPGTRLDTALMEERLRPALGSLAVVDATASYDYAQIAAEPTVRGHVVRALLERGKAGEAALRYALAAFDGTDIAP